VTGPVLELTDKVIVVQKGNERWEIARDEKSRIEGDVKVGSKVTVHYRMVAVSVDPKGEKGNKGKTTSSARPAFPMAGQLSSKGAAVDGQVSALSTNLVASQPSVPSFSKQAQTLQAAQSKLYDLRSKYTEQHPWVRAKRQQIEEIQRDMAASALVNREAGSR
jgi:uncharacterized protein involved in exopolysaccharide biosynthesis